MGLDLSLAGTGIVLLGNGVAKWRWIETKRLDELPKKAEGNPFWNGKFYGTTEERIAYIAYHFMCGWDRYRPSLVCIEEYAFSRHSRALSPLHELGGTIKHYLTLIDALWLPTVRDQVMKDAGLKAKASKPESVAGAVARGFTLCPNGDIGDAFHHALYGYRNFASLVEAA